MGNQQMTVQLVKQACNLLSTQCVQFWRLQAVCLTASSKSNTAISERIDGPQSLQAKYQVDDFQGRFCILILLHTLLMRLSGLDNESWAGSPVSELHTWDGPPAGSNWSSGDCFLWLGVHLRTGVPVRIRHGLTYFSYCLILFSILIFHLTETAVSVCL